MGRLPSAEVLFEGDRGGDGEVVVPVGCDDLEAERNVRFGAQAEWDCGGGHFEHVDDGRVGAVEGDKQGVVVLGGWAREGGQ